MSDYINVKSSDRMTPGRVVIWEKDKAHPDGEIFIASDGQVVTVGKTEQVTDRLNKGELIEVKDAPKPAEKVETDKQREAREEREAKSRADAEEKQRQADAANRPTGDANPVSGTTGTDAVNPSANPSAPAGGKNVGK